MIARFAIRHPVTVAMAFLASLLLGVLALTSLPVDLLPDLQAPRIAVLLKSGDRPPEELEDAYGRFLETVLSTLQHVTSVRTISSTGRVLAIVEYDWTADMDFALLDVQSQVEPIATDRDVDSLVVRRFDPAQEPILVVGLKPIGGGTTDLDGLRRLAEDRVARALERVEGVALVQVAGGRKREIEVEVEPSRLQALGLTSDRIVSILQQSNAEAAGGTIEDKGRVHVIKGLGAFHGLDDVENVPVLASRPEVAGSPPSAAPLRLGEIARVRWADAPVRGLVTVDGTEGVSLSVYKEAGENTVRVADRVRKALSTLRPDLSSLSVVVVRDQSEFIQGAIREVESAALLGGILSILVLVFFLRSPRAIVLIALAIPVSVVTTFALMSLFGLSLNIMTLGGLALGTGIVIDNAIVVLEATFRRLEEGEAPEPAAEHGATEVGAAITASTLTHCVVFLPVVFLHGIASELFGDLAFTVVASLVASLAVAMLLIPAAAARLFRTGASLGRGSHLLLGPYGRLIESALRRPGLVVTLAGASVVAAVLIAPKVGVDFLPPSDSGEVTVRLLMPEGTRVTVTQQAAARLEDAVREAFPNALESAHAELGEAVQEDLVLSEEIPAENRGILRLRLRRDAKVATSRVAAVVASAAGRVEALSVKFESSDAVLGRLVQTGPPVRVDIRGQDLEAIERTTGDVRDALARLPELADVHSSFEDRRAEVKLVLDRAVIAGLGLTPDAIGRQLRQRLGAEAATKFRLDDEERDVVVRSPAASLAMLPGTMIDTPSRGPMRLADIAHVEVVTSPTRIERSVGARTGSVTAQVAPGSSLGAASRRVEAALAATKLPPGLRAALGGAEVTRRASFKELLLAVGLAIALVYMVLASLFESIIHPFTILFTLPTAGVGVVLAFVLTGTTASVPAFLGIVMLAGIAVNNGILLVDVANRLRVKGASRHDAIVRAGRLRLRPILMTSLATMLGMVPMALGGRGSELRAPLAIAVIGGLLSSTLLTLVLIPVVYDLVDRVMPKRAATDEAP